MNQNHIKEVFSDEVFVKNLMELENQYQSLEKEYKKLIELNLQKEEETSAEG